MEEIDATKSPSTTGTVCIDQTTTPDVSGVDDVTPPSPCNENNTKNSVQALQWPPRSPCQILQNAWLYTKGIVGPLEVIFWICVLYISYQLGGK